MGAFQPQRTIGIFGALVLNDREAVRAEKRKEWVNLSRCQYCYGEGSCQRNSFFFPFNASLQHIDWSQHFLALDRWWHSTFCMCQHREWLQEWRNHGMLLGSFITSLSGERKQRCVCVCVYGFQKKNHFISPCAVKTVRSYQCQLSEGTSSSIGWARLIYKEAYCLLFALGRLTFKEIAMLQQGFNLYQCFPTLCWALARWAF